MGKKKIIKAQLKAIISLKAANENKQQIIHSMKKCAAEASQLRAENDNQRKANIEMVRELKELTADRDRCSKAYGEAKAELSRYRQPLIF